MSNWPTRWASVIPASTCAGVWVVVDAVVTDGDTEVAREPDVVDLVAVVLDGPVGADVVPAGALAEVTRDVVGGGEVLAPAAPEEQALTASSPTVAAANTTRDMASSSPTGVSELRQSSREVAEQISDQFGRPEPVRRRVRLGREHQLVRRGRVQQLRQRGTHGVRAADRLARPTVGDEVTLHRRPR